MALTAQQANRELAGIWPGCEYEILELTPVYAKTWRDLSEITLRPGGFVPGPAQFAIADAVLWYLVFGALDRVEPMAMTAELSMRFLRPGVGARLFAEARLDKAGRRSVVGTVRVWTDDNTGRPCSTGQGTYMLP